MVKIVEEENTIIITIDIRNTNDFLLFSLEYFKYLGINYIDSYIKIKDDELNYLKNNNEAETKIINNNEIIIKTKGGDDYRRRLTIPYRYFVYLISGRDSIETLENPVINK